MVSSTASEVTFPAVAYDQGRDRTLFAFVAESTSLSSFLAISRIERDEKAQIDGYQRPELASHIEKIRSYLASSEAFLPTAMVVALPASVRFEAHSSGDGSTRTGVLHIPLDGEHKPGWIVDGQQRMAALLDAGRDNFHVCLIGFVAETIEEQREQFILVNSAKPLPRGLIYELLPATDCPLPPFLEKRKFPSELLARLNFESASPFYHRIKTPTNPDGIIKDNSVLKMIENSLSDGLLYRFREPLTGSHDTDAMVEALSAYWRAVSDIFPAAWATGPRASRLTHGAGIVSMGYLMDAIADYHIDRVPRREDYAAQLAPLAPICCWTEGYWPFGTGAERRWNDIQNRSNDIIQLANFLLVQHRRLMVDGPDRVILPGSMPSPSGLSQTYSGSSAHVSSDGR